MFINTNNPITFRGWWVWFLICFLVIKCITKEKQIICTPWNYTSQLFNKKLSIEWPWLSESRKQHVDTSTEAYSLQLRPFHISSRAYMHLSNLTGRNSRSILHRFKSYHYLQKIVMEIDTQESLKGQHLTVLPFEVPWFKRHKYVEYHLNFISP